MELNTEFILQALMESMKGIPTTLIITIVTMLLSSPIAFFFAIRRLAGGEKGNRIIRGYISFVRGTPIVLQILFFYSLLPTTLNHVFNTILGLHLPIFDMNPIVYAFAVFTLNTTAVLTEVFRSALFSIGPGQMEAALSVGLTTGQAYRRIIVPQGLTAALPNICNTTISVLKSTSLAYMMTVQDIMAIAKKEAAFGYNYIEAYLVVLILYIVLCTVVQLLFRAAEKRISVFRRTSVA
ncbi:MAG: amino acid ABC transporter permease [Clostridium sp.]|nr:amino acid ABC transporter permease [Clostridium sp.]